MELPLCSLGKRYDRHTCFMSLAQQKFYTEDEGGGWLGFFFPAADRKWDKMNKRKLFASPFFLPNCFREMQNRARQVGQL